MPRPLTQEERDRFEEIRFGDLENVCLIQTAYDGVETVYDQVNAGCRFDSTDISTLTSNDRPFDFV